ncbi:MAG TPA: hypothetical protein VMG08_08680 [Allosphingosinicella sp.]|nr:hypothetical protein [Allosphingosinicella sp.]
MSSIWLVAGLMFATTGEVGILPPCCAIERGRPDIEDPPSIPVRADTRRPDERALEEGAEAPIPVPLPVLIARPVSTEEPVLEPDVDIETAPCCQSAPGDVDDPPPLLVPANVRPPAERERMARDEARVPADASVSTAAPAPAELRPDIEVAVPALLLLLAIGLWFSKRRRRAREDAEPLPPTRPLPNALSVAHLASIPMLEPMIRSKVNLEAVRQIESA